MEGVKVLRGREREREREREKFFYLCREEREQVIEYKIAVNNLHEIQYLLSVLIPSTIAFCRIETHFR